MSDWNVKRLEINRKVRKVFVRNGIDLGLISVRVYPRRIVLRGNLARVRGAGERLDAAEVEAIIRQLERIEEVNHVFHDLGNWKFCNASRKWERLRTSDESVSMKG